MLKKITLLLLSLSLTAFVFAGCAKKESKGTVKLVYVEWDCAVASTHVAKAVIEERLGYTVEVLPVAAAAMWQSIGAGEADAMTTAWLPVTHADYLAKVKDNVEDLGPNYKGAKIGLVVPSYVTIDTLADLKTNIAKFNNQIIGIDPGAGLMKLTEKYIKKNGVDAKLIEGSGATMTAALKDAIDKKEWIVVTGWAPHWKFGRWDLKILKDPKQEFGAEETINTVVRKGLKNDMPEVYNFLDKFNWSNVDISKVMVANQEKRADYNKTAREWVKENKEKVDSWLK
ncbi:MAG TPA: glycine betaine ABC transporter substrate-binding protein [Spirochaetota bacterium]|nr:glycine betaine ABC transporter substrate-binding protein [Spirochaetota bacterium]HPF06409.1 glycine betaine ABC transporter substrate-binding protein [Spirochaetota bacterium]HPJ41629.1 glycine betaine ABC transporter substrate-binding protein [Spirochaetota bacterium]HPR36699.1 glycine betaine ABC transporter substrate-binding protein [Spirochaetota bacterium]HRX47111.1 glycine betaine ABC transporter substrate-binding protein [Spirochaetota bacterium]